MNEDEELRKAAEQAVMNDADTVTLMKLDAYVRACIQVVCEKFNISESDFMKIVNVKFNENMQQQINGAIENYKKTH